MEDEEREKRRKRIAAEDDERELKREEDKLKRRGLRGIALRQEMLEVNEGIVRRRLQRDRERMDSRVVGLRPIGQNSLYSKRLVPLI